MTEKGAHTPGPWKMLIQPITGEGILVSADDEAQNIIVCDPYGPNPQDAPLIEAAPEMLASLKEVAGPLCSFLCPSVWQGGGPQPHGDVCKRLRGVLARVEKP